MPKQRAERGTCTGCGRNVACTRDSDGQLITYMHPIPGSDGRRCPGMRQPPTGQRMAAPDGYRLNLTHRDIARFHIGFDWNQPTLMCTCSTEPVLHIDGHSLGDLLLSAEGHQCQAGP